MKVGQTNVQSTSLNATLIVGINVQPNVKPGTKGQLSSTAAHMQMPIAVPNKAIGTSSMTALSLYICMSL